MRRLWCQRCKAWIAPYDPREQTSEQARREHDRWCGLDIYLPETHPELVDLNAELDRLYDFSD